MGTCGDVDAGPNPFGAPAQCTSMAATGDTEDEDRYPGRACVACHTQKGTQNAPGRILLT